MDNWKGAKERVGEERQAEKAKSPYSLQRRGGVWYMCTLH